MDINALISKGPSSPEEVAAAAQAVKDSADVLADDNTKVSEAFKAFDAVKAGVTPEVAK